VSVQAGALGLFYTNAQFMLKLLKLLGGIGIISYLCAQILIISSTNDDEN
jgi:hypothetical protein